VDTSRTPAEINHDRRRFLGTAAAAVGAAGAVQLGMIGSAKAEARPAAPAAARARTAASFGPVKQIDAGVLNVGYVEAGPANGPPVLLLHGFPYDIHSFTEVTPLLAAQGYRVIVPYMRGHGTTTFRSSRTRRDAQQSVMALDVLALMDALKIEKAVLAGYDLGSRSADIIAALWPRRCKALVSTTGYLITNPPANLEPAKPSLEWAFWYQYYFSTERGVKGLTEFRHDLGELIWRFNSPTWHFSQATYDATAAAFDNPDYVAIIIDNYRWRLDLVPGDPRYAAIEKKLDAAPAIAVPTVTVDGQHDPFTPPGDGAAYRAHFTGKYAHHTLPVGHNVPQEDPRGFARAVVQADHL
jgi:pimeloyl-ACP methyl ester carboxylesterase